MTTAGALVDRVYRDWLHPGDEQPARTRLTAGVDAVTATWTVDTDVFAADEVDMLAAGVIVEAGSEQALIRDRSGGTLTVTRAVNGTTAATHASAATVTVAPTYGRKTVFDAVADSVVSLWPRLWNPKTTAATVTLPLTELPEDFGAADHWRPTDVATAAPRYPFEAITDPDATYGMSALIDDAAGTEGYIVYRARFLRPASEAADLTATHGVRGEWERIVAVGAVAQILFGTPELDPVVSEYVTRQLEAETYPPRTSGQIAARLMQYRDELLREAADGLRQERLDRVHFVRPLGGVLI